MVAWLIALVIGLPWLGALCVCWVGDLRPRAQHLLAISFTLAGGMAALVLLFFASDISAIRWPLAGIFGDVTFVPDGLGVFLAAIASIIGSLTVIFSVDYMRGEKQLSRYYALVLLFIGAMSGLVLTSSLLVLFLFWELVAVCSYALISFHNDDPKAVSGGIKALVITQIGGIGLLIGILTTYAYLGSYQITDLLTKANTLPSAALGLIAFGFLAAAAAKSAQIPFHTWLPGAMEAPTPVSALIHAATMVNAGVYLLARFYPAFASVSGWTTAVSVIGVLSALLAGMMALVATDLKRVLAYSTISQLGYMVYAVGVGAVFASQFHLLSHAVFKALLFLGAGAVIHATGTRDLRRMGGLGRRMPFVRNSFVIGGLALAGVPIFNGFWSKELVLEAAVASGFWWVFPALLIGVFLTALYSLRMVRLVFYGESYRTPHIQDAPTMMRAALIPLAVGTATTWLLVESLGHLLETTLPFHQLHTIPLGQMVSDVIGQRTSAAALIVIALALMVWMTRHHWMRWLVNPLNTAARVAAHDFGFESLNARVVGDTRYLAALFQRTQTGQLNWNIAGLLIGLIVVLIIIGGWR